MNQIVNKDSDLIFNITGKNNIIYDNLDYNSTENLIIKELSLFKNFEADNLTYIIAFQEPQKTPSEFFREKNKENLEEKNEQEFIQKIEQIIKNSSDFKVKKDLIISLTNNFKV